MKKEDSVALQGFAVLIMMLLHFFLDIRVYRENFFWFPEIFQRFAWMGRMCVGIYSFVSGYGMYQVLKKKDSLTGMTIDCIKRLLSLYARLFLVIILCVYLPRFILGEEILISQLPGNLFGYNAVYNGAWWFVFEYMWFMLLTPILAILVDSRVKKGVRVLLTLGLFALALFGKGIIFTNVEVVEFFEVRMQPTFMFMFAEGFGAGKIQEVAGKMRYSSKLREFVRRVRYPKVGAVLCFVALSLRYLYSADPYRANADILLVPLLCCGASLYFRSVYSLKKVLFFFGQNSLYLWFVHNLVYDRLFHFLVQRVGYWLVFYLVMLVVCLILSILLRYVEKLLKMVKGKLRVR